MEVTMSLTQYLKMGGKIENLDKAKNRRNDEYGSISYSHKNAPSFGNPNGVHMYNVGDKKIAECFVEVHVKVDLNVMYL